MMEFSQSFSIECDASVIGIGVVLSQNKKAIAFLRKPLSKLSLNKSFYEKELMALVAMLARTKIYCIYRPKNFKIPVRVKDYYSKSEKFVG